MNKKWVFGGFFAFLVVGFSFYQAQNTQNFNTPNNNARKLASDTQVSLAYLSEKYQYNGKELTLDDHILNISDAAQIQPLAKEIISWDKQYNPVKDGKRVIKRELLRVYAIIAQYVEASEGFIYRLRDIGDKDMGVYAASLTALRNIKYVSSETPSHINALFDYLTNPNPGKNIGGQTGIFETPSSLSDYLVKNIAPKLERSVDELGELIQAGSVERPLFVTNLALSHGRRIASIIKNEPDNSNVALDKIVLAGHLYETMASIETFLGSLYYTASFDLDDTYRFNNKVYKQVFMQRSFSGFSSLVGRDLVEWNNLPAPKELKKYVLSVRKGRLERKAGKPSAVKERVASNFLRLREINYLAQSKDAYKNAAELDYTYHMTLLNLASLPSQESYIVNASVFDGHSHGPLEAINIKRELLNSNGPVEIKNFTTNEKMMIDVNKFFDPEVMSDLVTYMPDGFNQEKEFYGRGDNMKWNYMYGRSEHWPNPKFGGIFPNGEQQEVRKNLATVYQHPALTFLSPVMSLYR